LSNPNTTFDVGQGVNFKTFTIQSALLSSSPVLSADAMRFMKEDQTGVTNLPHDDPEIFAIVLDFLQTASLYDPVKSGTALPNTVAELSIMADKFQLVELQYSVIKAISTGMTDKMFLEGISFIYEVGIDLDKKLLSAIGTYLYEESLAATKNDITDINKFIGYDDKLLAQYLSALHDASATK
jgi:hypothetical protein